ncbi:hypothetical protein MLD38_033801 [Melastoma candidum]|uniref:Uncharacterized protein n=1 Tax=Melastoma candidum TaxID=119954 RepID=A0ACB9M814_9MYRT|nr:hypothetical protein MLD38_033801 [Melastoma candidum]
MKRKKWTEQEELTLLTKYADLSSTGALSKLKTREKKFRPIADHVSDVHHLVDPVRFPFRWTWRDVSVKVQNMRNQYVGVKHKIRTPDGLFDWSDGDNHWENFLKYKEVFGDVELLETKDKDRASGGGVPGFDDGDGDGDDYDAGLEEGDAEIEAEDGEEANGGDAIEQRRELMRGRKRKRSRLGEFGKRVLGLREAMVRREEERSEREFRREKGLFERELKQKEAEFQRELETERESESRDMEELEERLVAETTRRESERWVRLMEGFVEEERARRMRAEEKREEEEMEWRERMVCLQMEHEKAMMQMHADACQNQLQILGVMARMVCQLYASIGGGGDGLGGGGSSSIGGLHLHPHQVLQNLHHHHHPSGLDDGVKPDGGNSPSEFL